MSRPDPYWARRAREALRDAGPRAAEAIEWRALLARVDAAAHDRAVARSYSVFAEGSADAARQRWDRAECMLAAEAWAAVGVAS